MVKAKAEANKQPAAIYPRYMRVELTRILEPEIAARATMDDHKMRELEESLRTIGQIQPVILEERESMYEIVIGHRRFLAARNIHWTELAAIVYQEGQADIFALRLDENVVREDLNAAEEALFFAQVREKFSLDEAGLMARFHKSANYIASRFALLRGDPEIFAALQRGEIRIGCAHELNRITDEPTRRNYLDVARRSDPPQRIVHGWVEQFKITQQPVLDAMAAQRAAGLAPANGAGENGAPQTPAEAGAAWHRDHAVPAVACCLCGGYRDPSNLVSVFIHSYELDQILKQIEKAQKGG